MSESTPPDDASKLLTIEDDADVTVPTELPILPLRGVVTFPSAVIPLLISRAASVQAVEAALAGDQLLGLVAQKEPDEEHPDVDGLFSQGTLARILKRLNYPDGSMRILVQGLRRIALVEYVQREPFLRARVSELPDNFEHAGDLGPLQAHIVSQFSKFVEQSSHLPDELQGVVANLRDPVKLGDLVAANLTISVSEKQELLGTADVRRRLEKLATILNRELELGQLGEKIQSQVQDELSKNQRDFYLRQQLRAIQKELGEGDARESGIEELRAKLEAADPPEAARKAAEAELERLKVIPVESAEHSVVRTYIEWIVSLPWRKSTEDNLDIAHARQVLDEDHYGLEKIKDRILEFLAVRRLKKDSKGPILCFVGPPGTGKTSLGRSIARAMGRKYSRISLGGIRDEAEIRGHRRTYVGSLPGRIIKSIRSAESNNPVMIFDEIDKLGADFRGDPASALLEVLDPEQNSTFQDHYLDVPFDLSRVMFITTANLLDPIPGPLRDRMEVIELAGYTEEEKVEIARRHLIPKQLDENGIDASKLVFPEEGLRHLIRSYTKEAGLRNIEREIGSICRKIARAVSEGATEVVVASPDKIRELLGPEKFFSEVAERTDEPGVATGLVWTPMGGDIVFIEATRMSGKKGLTLTGQLGDVMQESAQAALSYVRAKAERLDIDPSFFDTSDIHIHVPAGAVPKDGPSAGVTMATALTSLLTGRQVRHDVAMTGEITLRGKVLPVGGIKEKVLGAHRAGIKTVILPKRNEKDLEDVPEEVRKALRFVFVDSIDDVLPEALVAPAAAEDIPEAAVNA